MHFHPRNEKFELCPSTDALNCIATLALPTIEACRNCGAPNTPKHKISCAGANVDSYIIERLLPVPDVTP
jgi:hypothetical protein